MKSQLMKFIAVALVLLISSVPFTIADCDESRKDNQRGEQSCDPQQLYQCVDFVRGEQQQEQEQEQDRPSDMCCQQLRGMDQQCRCDAIQKMFNRAQGGGGGGGGGDNQYGRQQEEMMLQRARVLTQLCNVERSQCDIQRHRAQASRIFMPGNVW